LLLLVRHGQTASNQKGHLLGRVDPPLTAVGWQQAEALALWLPRADRVVSSPLLRARQTASVLSDDVVVDERWTELDYGPYDDAPVSAISDELWLRWRTDPSFTPPGIEPHATLTERVTSACDDMAPAAQTSVLIVVTHVSPIKAALAWALGVPSHIAWRTFVEDAGVSRIDIGPDGPIVRWFNRGH
jgi:broad specificity phosphatase PhoE